MKRGDVAVFAISATLAAVVAVAVAYSVLALDRGASAVVSRGAESSWLVVTWGPDFCEANPADAICASGEVGGMGETLILHGLWPQPPERQNCGVAQRLAASDLSDDVRARLQSVMADSADLVPHEWSAHGTCAGVTPDVYFGDAASLTAQVRGVLDPVFHAARGGQLTLQQVRDRVDSDVGAGLGDRFGLACRRATGIGPLVVDVRVSLPPVAALRAVDGSLTLGRLLTEAPPIDPGCRSGRVADPR